MPDGDVTCPTYAYNISNHTCSEDSPGSNYAMSYDFAWRMPYVLEFEYNNEIFALINIHLKCCGSTGSSEEARRYEATVNLSSYISNNLSDKNVLVLGDLNDDIAESSQNNVFQMILEDPENYLFVDFDIANGSSSDWSYPTWPSHLDHILITNELFDELDNSDIQTIKIDEYLDGGWSEYDQNISDHRPVALKLDFGSSINGDVNQDGDVNILDVVSMVNIVLSGEYNNLADFNNDGAVDVLDIVQLVNLILNQ